MAEGTSIQAWKLAEEIARAYYLRTGMLVDTAVFLAEIERKFNPYHDPDDGRFTFGPGGPGAGMNRAGMAERPVRREPRYPIRIVLPEPKPGAVRRSVAPAVRNPPAIRFSYSKGIDLPAEVIDKANSLSDSVYLRTGHRIHVTSGRRPPHRQAAAMYDNYQNDRHPPKYANHAAENEIHHAFLTGKKQGLSREQTTAAMAKILERQVSQGVFLSAHMRSNAVDIRTPSPRVLEAIRKHPSVKTAAVEDDHIHVRFH